MFTFLKIEPPYFYFRKSTTQIVHISEYWTTLVFRFLKIEPL